MRVVDLAPDFGCRDAPDGPGADRFSAIAAMGVEVVAAQLIRDKGRLIVP